MATETASLIVVVDSTGVAAATAQLDALTAAGARAEAALGSSSGLSAAADAVTALGTASTGAASGMSTAAEASLAVEAASTKAKDAVNAFGETSAQADARIKGIVASYMAQAEAGGQIVLSERAIAEAAGQRVEATVAEIAATQAAIAAQDAQMTSMDAYIGTTEASVAVTEASTVAVAENAVAFTMNSRSMAEVSTIVSDIATGQFGRMRRSVAALANSSGAIKALFSGVGLAAVAVGALGFAALKGAEQEDELNRSLLSTGNYAGTTTGQLNALAESMAGGAVTIGKARDAVNALTASGRFSGEQITVLAQATVDAGTLMGQSVKQVVDEFTRLQESPVAASEKLNDQYHYLTTSVLQQIVALQQQGDTIGAATLAMNTYADSLRTRTSEAEAQLGTLQKAWDSIKSSASFAWDAMLGLGRPTDELGKISAQYDQLLKQRQAVAAVAAGKQLGVFDQVNLPTAVSQYGGGDSQAGQEAAKNLLPGLDAQIAALNTARKLKQSSVDAAAAQVGVAQDVQAAGTKGVEELTKLGISLDGYKSKQDKVNAAAEAFYAIHLAGGKLPAGVDFNGPTADLPEGAGWNKIKDQLLHGKHHNTGPSALNTFQNQVNALDASSYTSSDNSAAAKYTSAMVKLNDELQTAIKKHADITQATAAYDAGVKTLQGDLAAASAKQKEVTDAYAQNLANSLSLKENAISIQVASVGMGTKEIAQMKEMNALKQQQIAADQRLNDQRAKGSLSEKQYNDELAASDAYFAKLKTDTVNGWQAMDVAQGSWLNGAKSAMLNFENAGQNTASMTAGFFNNTFTSMTNSLTTFVTTGKLNFTSLVTSILTDLTRIIVKYEETKALQAILGMFGGGAGGGGGGLSNSGALAGNGSTVGSFSGFGMMAQAPNALGGVYSSPSLSAYSGQVVNSPTTFAFANGAGLMGEAGPEAIMPLTRTSDGKLGVQSAGGSGGAPSINVTIQTVIQPNGSQQTQAGTSGKTNDLAKQLAEEVKGVVNQQLVRQSQPNGLLWKLVRGQTA